MAVIGEKPDIDVSTDIHLDTKQGIEIKERDVLFWFHIN
jgi:hypothetical protein